jgi:hypothetical protein
VGRRREEEEGQKEGQEEGQEDGDEQGEEEKSGGARYARV